LSNITSGTHDAAVIAAKQETQRLLETPPILQTISSHITQANDAALKATQSAAGAHAAASEAEDSLTSLKTTLAADKEVVSAIKDLNKFVDDISKNPEFQTGVVAKVTAQITKLESELRTWEGNPTYIPTAPIFVMPPQTHAPDHYSSMSCPQGNFMTGMTLFTDVNESFLQRAQILCRPLIPR
jgi:prefoldin subunit 5